MPAGTALVYAGYIGGTGFDRGFGIAVDGAGNAYVTGFTDSTEASFPVTVGPDLTFNGCGTSTTGIEPRRLRGQGEPWRHGAGLCRLHRRHPF